MGKTGRILFWLVSAMAFGFFSTLPVSTLAQSTYGIILVIFIMAMKPLELTGTLRVVVLCCAIGVIFRYIYWRTTETIPPVADLYSFIPGMLLYLAELYSYLMLMLSIFVVSNPMPHQDAPDFTDEEAPTVDVFIPTYNEDEQLLSMTIAGACNMDYPTHKKVIWLLDDGGTEQKRNQSDKAAAQSAQERYESLQRLCDKFGIHYLTREKNEAAKAGNLNNGLEYSEGSLVAVFDADHIPAPNYLRETVGYFLREEKLFLVQTPHFFRNADPIERNLGLSGKVPSENDMFYGVIQRGLDRWDGSFFCGSAALLSRKALVESNGFAGKSITEDCESAVELHAKGWSSRYVDKPLISGLQPETFSSLIGQRSRWAQGMMQILMMNRPFLKSGLKIGQRLCYVSSTFFWLFPFSRLVFLLAPFCYLLFDLRIFIASAPEFFSYTVSYMMMSLLLQNMMFARVRRPWVSEVYEFAQSFHLFRALISVVMHPTKPTFKVTSKDELVEETHLSDMYLYFLIVFLLTVFGMAIAGYRYYVGSADTGILIVVSLWNFLNFLLAGCALGCMVETPEKNMELNVDIPGIVKCLDHSYAATVTKMNEKRLELVVKNYSPDTKLGECIDFRAVDGSLTLSARITDLSAATDCHDVISVAPILTPEVSCQLTDKLFSIPEVWQRYDKSQSPRGIFMGTVDFVVMSFTGIERFCRYGLKAMMRRKSVKQNPDADEANHGVTYGGEAQSYAKP